MGQLLFHSTNGESPAVSLRAAMLAGQAPDRGLYFPRTFPQLAPSEIAGFAARPYHEIAFRVLSKFTADIIPDDVLAAMCREAYGFTVPLEKTYEYFSPSYLFRGPRPVITSAPSSLSRRIRYSAQRLAASLRSSPVSARAKTHPTPSAQRLEASLRSSPHWRSSSACTATSPTASPSSRKSQTFLDCCFHRG